MKPEVLQSLLTAKVLINKAQELCFVEDKFTASSGLIVLQDAIELVMLAALVEISADERKALDSLPFDQLIGELKKEKIRVIKSGTLKALNKQRVIVKHYGQVSEPQTVGTYFTVASKALDSILEQVIGKRLDQIVLNELIHEGETKECLTKACEALQEENYLGCLISVRKAIFLEIENEYCVYEWRDVGSQDSLGLFPLGVKGKKAPYSTRNKEWIGRNVKDPFDYVQLDHDQIRQDLLEWGASTQDFWNLWRLTPQVIRLEEEGEWLLKGELKHLNQAATQENAIFCLDRAVTLLAKKQAHHDSARWLNYSIESQLRVKIAEPADVYEKALASSSVVTRLKPDEIYLGDSVVPGLDGKERYVHVFGKQGIDPKFFFGYVELGKCYILEGESEV